jgi:carboxylesterase
MIYLLLFAIIVLTLLWSAQLWGYKEKFFEPITPDVDHLFSARCAPIELTHSSQASRAILMIHGFPSSPYPFRWAAQASHTKGYDVFVPLLPGFGTTPEDLKDTSFTQWFEFVEKLYLEKREMYEKVFLVGTSMGGAMALKLAQKYNTSPLQPNGVCTVGAPVFLNDLFLGAVQKPAYYVMRLVSLFTYALSPGVYIDERDESESNDGEEFWVGYTGSFVQGGVSLAYNLKQIRKDLGRIHAPLLVIHDKRDKTIHYKNQQEITSHVNSSHIESITTELTSDHNRHILLMYPSIRDTLIEQMLTFFNFCS